MGEKARSGVSSTVDFKVEKQNISRYRYSRIQLDNLTGNSCVIGPSATTPLQWKIPAGTPFNWDQSYIQYSYVIPAGGAGTYAYSNELSQDLASSLDWSDGAGKSIVSLQYADRFCRIMQPMRTKFREMETRDQLQTCYKSNTLASANYVPFGVDGVAANSNVIGTVNYTEPKYLQVQTTANTALSVYRELPLGSFVDTAVAMDKTIIMPATVLRISSLPGARMGFYSVSATNPSNTPTSVTGNITMSNIYLFLALEQNEEIILSLQDAFMRNAIKMQVPYVYGYRNTSTGSTTNYQINLTQQQGKKLRYIVHSAFNSNENQGNLAFDCSNQNGSKVLNISTSCGSRPIQDYPLNCYNPNPYNATTGVINSQATFTSYADDFREMQKWLKGSTLGQSYAIYANTWSYADTWGSRSSTVEDHSSVPSENIDDGLSLTNGNINYAVTMSTPNPAAGGASTNTTGLVIYSFQCTQRDLHVGVNGFDLI